MSGGRGALRGAVLVVVGLGLCGFESCPVSPLLCVVFPGDPRCEPGRETIYSVEQDSPFVDLFDGYPPFGRRRLDARWLDPEIRSVQGAAAWNTESGQPRFLIATSLGAYFFLFPSPGVPPSPSASRSGAFRIGEGKNLVSSFETLDADTVLLGQQDTTGNCSSGVQVCDVRAGSCVAASGLPACSSSEFPYVLRRVAGSGSTASVLAGYARTGIYRSSDGGRTWSASSTGLPAFSTVRAIQTVPGSILAAMNTGIYRSSDQGVSWTRSSIANSTTGLAAQGSRLFASVQSSLANVYTSSDSGATWTSVPFGGRASVAKSIAASPASIVFATDAGPFRSTDSGATWTSIADGLQIWNVVSLAESGSAVVAGVFLGRNGILRSTDGGRTFANGPADLDNASIDSVVAQGASVLVGTFSATYRSTDGGLTYTRGTPSGLPSGTTSAFASVGDAIYATRRGQGVFRSLDGGATFSPAGTGLDIQQSKYAFGSHGGATFAGAQGKLFRSPDGTTWSEAGIVFPSDASYSITSLVSHQGALYAGLYGLGVPDTHGVYRSVDGGATFTRMSTGISLNSLISSLASTGSTLYAGSARYGLYASTDGGQSWTQPVRSLVNVPVTSLLLSSGALFVGTQNASVFRVPVPLADERVVPVVLDVSSGSARFTTELALTNRGTTPVRVTLTYTASIGSGSGSVEETLAAGQQLVIADVIAHLRQGGLAIPGEGAQVGTLRAAFSGLSSTGVVAATARTTSATTSPQPAGAAGLAYSAVRSTGGTGRLRVFGLRSTTRDRSNLAVLNLGSDPITLRITAFSGSGGASTVVAEAETLPAYGWKQINEVLAGAGYANGWVQVDLVSASGAFSAYGVVNDNGTNDGSFVLPSLTLPRLPYATLPVIVETTGATPFISELVLANASTRAATLRLRYVESLSPSLGAGGTATLTLPAGTQRIEPDAVEFLRGLGIGIGSKGSASFAGSLRVEVLDAPIEDVYLGARTASPSPAGGQFGLFTGPALFGDEASGEAYLYGLQANERNRSNVAVVNAGNQGPITLQLQAYDGDDGGRAKGAASSVVLQPGQWSQLGSFLAASGVRNGWVKVTRTAGTELFVAYAVVNDGGAPGDRTGDGAFVAMELP